MVREWPRQQAQTKAAMKKERPLEEKVLAEVKKRVSQIEETLKPALESSSFSSNTTKEVEKTAHAVAKVCVCVCVQLVHHFDANWSKLTFLGFSWNVSTTIRQITMKSGF